MASIDIYKLASGAERFRVRWAPGAGGSRGGFKKRTDAQKFLEEYEAAQAPTDEGVRLSPNMTVDGFLAVIDVWADRKPSTRGQYKYIYNRHVQPQFGGRSIRTITSFELQVWLDDLRKRYQTGDTARSYAMVFWAILRRAHALGVMPVNPVVGVELPAKKPPPRKGTKRGKGSRTSQAYPIEKIDLIAEVINPRFKAAVLVLGYGGLRIGEMLALPRSAVNFETDTISVFQAQVAGETGARSLGDPKTDGSVRDVILPGFVMAELARTMLQNGNDSEFVFPNLLNGGMLAYTSFMRYWKPACQRAGVPALTHNLRHSHISHLHNQLDTPSKAIQERVGHSRLSTTEVYLHTEKDADRKIADALQGRRTKRKAS